MNPRYVIGIDEVGRGSLAGPVVVAAVLATSNWQLATGKPRGRLRDSKKLTPKQRKAWFEFFKNHPQVNHTIARVYPRQIEKRNISNAANLAALRAYKRLLKTCRMSHVACRTYLDGGLYLGNGKWKMENGKLLKARTIVKGDEKIKAIAIASIIAKVHRDRLMVRLAKKYPRYGFEAHKGYGTRAHIAAIKKYGPSMVHRKTFVSKII